MNLWEAAKRGALTRLVQLIEDGVHCVDDLDEGRNSALHWAAINNHINVVMYLVDRGVPVDIIGGNESNVDSIRVAPFNQQHDCYLGDLKATPLHWAARTGLVNMVHLLYKRGADPNIKDGQGYNSLHLATHGGHVMMVVYLLSIGLEVDSVDEYGRSSLMWAAYQGNNMEVLEELLRWKASLFLRDSTGYTALHWAIISSHYEFGMKLVEEGSDIDAKDPAGKTPGQWAEERGLSDQYDRILVDSGKRQTAGRFNGPPFSQATTNRILYMVPYVLIPAAMLILGYLPFYLAVPLCIGGITLFQNMFVIKYLLAKKPWKVPNTPLIASVAQATLFFVFITWLRIVPCKALLLIILPGSQKAKRY